MTNQITTILETTEIAINSQEIFESIINTEIINITKTANIEIIKSTTIMEKYEEIKSTFIIDNNEETIATVPLLRKDGEVIKEIIQMSKEDLNIKDIIYNTEIRKNYEIKRNDFTLRIRPTNSSLFDNSTYVKLSKKDELVGLILKVKSFPFIS